MDHNETPELIEQQMHDTRESLTDKVAALENQVMGTLQSATTAVQETVQSVRSAVSDTQSTVKDTVQESLAAVKDTFDVAARTRENPWAMLGGAAVAGLVTGLLVFRKQHSLGMTAAAASGYQPPVGTFHSVAAPQPAAPRAPGLFDELLCRAGQELRKVAEDAIQTCSASLKEQLHQGVPKLFEQVTETVKDKVVQTVSGSTSDAPLWHNGRRLEPTM